MRAIVPLAFLAACGRATHSAGTRVPSNARLAPPAPNFPWVPLAGPHADLRAFDVEPADAGPSIRLVRRTWPIIGTSCHLAIHSEGAWYVADEAVGPCDTFADLPGDTIILSRDWRDVGLGRRELAVDVALKKTTRDLLNESVVVVVRRSFRASVICTVKPVPPRCAPPVLFPAGLREIEDAPFDILRDSPHASVRAWLLAR